MKYERLQNRLLILREALSNKKELMIHHTGEPWIARFEWKRPAKVNQVNAIDLQLPDDYKYFLTNISDGALLYYDVQYGQWGYKLYGTEDIVEKQKTLKDVYPNVYWGEKLIAFARSVGDVNYLSFDTSRPTKDNLNFAIREASLDKVDDWTVASRSFHEWLGYLIIAQGEKYWNWR